MRSRTIGLLPWAPATALAEIYKPVGVTLDKIVKWYWRVQSWSFAWSIDDGTTAMSAAGSAQWDSNQNNEVTEPPPTTEQYLGLGYFMRDQAVVDSGSPGNPAVQFRFFDVAFDTEGTRGASYGNTDLPHYPLMLISGQGPITGLISAPANPDSAIYDPSAVTCLVDDETIPMFELKAGPSFTGSITILPALYWEYRRSDGTNAIYNSLTGAQILDPHQLDQLR